jgi:hypothetical protein
MKSNGGHSERLPKVPAQKCKSLHSDQNPDKEVAVGVRVCVCVFSLSSLAIHPAHTAISYQCMRPSAASVCGLTLLVYAALSCT